MSIRKRVRSVNQSFRPATTREAEKGIVRIFGSLRGFALAAIAQERRKAARNHN